jgi:hypothetical protein
MSRRTGWQTKELHMTKNNLTMKLGHLPVSRRHALVLLAAAPLGAGLPAAADTLPEVMVHRDPSCGCCGAWVEHLKRTGFPVRIAETGNLNAVKQRLGVPADLISCHTAEVGGYVIEGHVPAGAIQRLLAQKPQATGLAVPGMPIGAPGMEGEPLETYEIVLFGPQGRRTFARYKGSREV